MAAQYALQAAKESGFLDSVEAHLDVLVDAGARFDFRAALQRATQD